MKTRSKKAKGRRLQDWVRNNLVKLCGVKPDAVRTAIMGERGVDVQLLTEEAKQLFPFRIECKNQEKFKALYEDYKQAQAHREQGEPLLIIKKNGEQPLAVVDAVYFMELIKNYNESSGGM